MNFKSKFSRGGHLLFCARNWNLIAKDALVGAAGMGNEDGDDEGPGGRCWKLDLGCSILVSGYSSLITGLRLLELWIRSLICWSTEIFGIHFSDCNGIWGAWFLNRTICLPFSQQDYNEKVVYLSFGYYIKTSYSHILIKGGKGCRNLKCMI